MTTNGCRNDAGQIVYDKKTATGLGVLAGVTGTHVDERQLCFLEKNTRLWYIEGYNLGSSGRSKDGTFLKNLSRLSND